MQISSCAVQHMPMEDYAFGSEGPTIPLDEPDPGTGSEAGFCSALIQDQCHLWHLGGGFTYWECQGKGTGSGRAPDLIAPAAMGLSVQGRGVMGSETSQTPIDRPGVAQLPTFISLI